MSEFSAEALAARVAALPRPLLLALDVDGTLAPIAPDPWAARVPDACVADLRVLGERDDVVLAFITGRDFSGLNTVLGPMPGTWRAVEHGALVLSPEVDAPAPRALHPEEKKRLDTLADYIEEVGGLLERKPASVSAHVRGMPPAEGKRILAAVEARAQELGVPVRQGRELVECELSPGDKGDALRRIRAQVEHGGVFFAGDDLTDGPAILEAAGDPHGVGIYIPSAERPDVPAGVTGTVAGTDAMHAFLAELRRLFPGGA